MLKSKFRMSVSEADGPSEPPMNFYGFSLAGEWRVTLLDDEFSYLR